MATKIETVLLAVMDVLNDAAALSDVVILRNAVVPEEIPAGGLLVVRDGEPGEPETVLGTFRNVFYSHAIEIDVIVAAGSPGTREAAFAALLGTLGEVLEANQTLNGTVHGMEYGHPAAISELFEGAEDIKAATVTIRVEYDAATPFQ